jgi:hypothetical protein
MAKGIFDTRSGSGYDDDIVERYQFPKRYLPIAQRFIGDWIVYREPRGGGGRSGYVAVARLVRTEPDPSRADRSYAYVDRFLAFDTVVPKACSPRPHAAGRFRPGAYGRGCRRQASAQRFGTHQR